MFGVFQFGEPQFGQGDRVLISTGNTSSGSISISAATSSGHSSVPNPLDKNLLAQKGGGMWLWNNYVGRKKFNAPLVTSSANIELVSPKTRAYSETWQHVETSEGTISITRTTITSKSSLRFASLAKINFRKLRIQGESSLDFSTEEMEIAEMLLELV